MSIDFQALRREYGREGLHESEVLSDPVEHLVRWLAAAAAAGVREPNAMTLATVGPDGAPSARIVLLKEIGERGLTFYTHYESRKGREIAHEPRAALLFFWPDLERQVRVEGTLERIPADESDAYFATRPRAAQLSAVASEQSHPIADRKTLEKRLAVALERYGRAAEIPRPPTWGGYRLTPRAIELWQGRENRLHDRLRFDRESGGAWRLSRLQP